MNKAAAPIIQDYWKYLARANDSKFSVQTRIKNRAKAQRCFDVMTAAAQQYAMSRAPAACQCDPHP